MTVTLPLWVLMHTLGALFWSWIVFWGGARRLEGWGAWLVVGWFAGHWNEAQLRLYAIGCLLLQCGWFALGLLFPALRFAA